ncbi:hypothetical protein K501DRAFT_328292 [Backusella circina FSU 941]|nr:hypothetical protein K501DRAFT_328292 [Backusella circina FSU 941]
MVGDNILLTLLISLFELFFLFALEVHTKTKKRTNVFSICVKLNSPNVDHDQSFLEARRVKIIYFFFPSPPLTARVGQTFLSKLLDNNSINRSYRPGKHRFIQWTLQHHIPFITFTPQDMINFLGDIQDQYSYEDSTLQLFRVAATHWKFLFDRKLFHPL